MQAYGLHFNDEKCAWEIFLEPKGNVSNSCYLAFINISSFSGTISVFQRWLFYDQEHRDIWKQSKGQSFQQHTTLILGKKIKTRNNNKILEIQHEVCYFFKELFILVLVNIYYFLIIAILGDQQLA